MMKLLVASLLFVASVNAIRSARGDFSQEWEDWKIKHGKQYAEMEEIKRQMTWETNRRFVAKHNYEYDLGLHTFTVGMNQFADMENEEFKAMYLSHMTKSANDESFCKAGPTIDARYANNDATVDWRTKGYVTPVKDQKQCGSCWAFSATGSLEGQHFKATGNLVSLSEQNLVDCSGKYGNLGCGGGFMDQAFHYIHDNGGIDTEATYPYTAMNGPCKYSNSSIGATLTSCVDVTSGSEKDLENAVASIGPISVAIDAGHMSFQLYKDGIYYEEDCSTVVLDHGVLVVGYGMDSGKAYWLVKNSWGAKWGGMKGYLKMSKDRNNNCGIATQASYPIV